MGSLIASLESVGHLPDCRHSCFTCRVGNLVSLRRILFEACRRALADKGDTNFERECLIFGRGQRSNIADQGPNFVLVLHMIEDSQLARQRYSHVQQTAALGWAFEREAGTERSNVQ